MSKKNKLNFSSERQVKAKRIRSFIISFSAFVIVLGSISLLMFLKSVNFDMSNLFNKAETTTETSTTEPNSINVNITGKSNLLLAVYDNANKLSFSFLIKSDMDVKTISVLNLPNDLVCSLNDSSMALSEHYSKNGISGMKMAVSNHTNLEVNKYIKILDSDLKKIIDKIGAVDVNIPTNINYKSSDFNLSLNAGNQNLSGDMLVKYLKITKGEDSSNAFVCFLKLLLSNKTIEAQDDLFYNFINMIETDISVVDYSNIRSVVSAFSNLPSESKIIKSIS